MFTEITQKTNTTYAGISNGRIVVRVPEGTEKSVSRINKIGNTVHEKFYSSISGFIKSMTIEDGKYEKQIKIYLENNNGNGANQAVLSFKFDSAYGRSFFNQIFNVDFSKEVSFNPWTKVTDDGTKVNRLYLNYGGDRNNKVLYQLPTDCPQIKWITRGDKSILDTASKLDHEEWIETNFNKLVKDNNLVWQSTDTDDVEPLTKDELLELKSMKEKAKKSNSDDDLDDIFN